MTQKNIGLALSGGGARGIAHLGVLQALTEAGIRPTVVAGTSAGSIVGALFSAGKAPNEVLNFLIKTNYLSIFRLARSFKGVLNMRKTDKIFKKILQEDDTFEKLKIPFYVAATCLETGTTDYFSEGELIRAIQASSCIPVLFSPMIINNKHYVDGGILNNLPTEVIRDKCDYLIGVHVNPLTNTHKVSNVTDLLVRTGYLAISANTKNSAKFCDWYIEPYPLHEYSIFDVGEAVEMFQVGYEYTKALLRSQRLASEEVSG